MKSLKNSFIAFIVIAVMLGLNSCTTYQYAFIKSNDRNVFQNDDYDFVKEEDNVTVSYCFSGEDLPVQITVENQTAKPVFINWNESALIVEDAAQSYANRKLITTGQIRSTTYHYRDYFDSRERIVETYGDFVGETTIPEETTFIPPHSRVTKTPLVLKDLYLDKIPKEIFSDQSFTASDGKNVSVKTVEFTDQDTPLRFKSYLTFFTTDNKGSREHSWSSQQSFYISELVEGGNLKPNKLSAFAGQHGDCFFVAKKPNPVLWGILGLVGVTIVAYFAMDAIVDTDMPSSMSF